MTRRASLGTRAKVLTTVTVLGAAASVAALGTFGDFTSTTSASTPVTSGIVSIALGAAGAANRLAVSATNIVPGDTIQRAVTLTSATSTDNLSAITLTTSASTSSVLDTTATTGLQLAIDKCSIAWVEAGVSPAYTYTCLGTTSSVLAARDVIGTSMALANLSALTAGSTDNLRVTLSLPQAAGNALQNKSSTILFAFTGDQRAGTNK